MQIRGSKRLSCHVGRQEVSGCCTRGEFEEYVAHRWQSMQARDPPWLWDPGQTSPEVQSRGISGPTKRTDIPQLFFIKGCSYCKNKVFTQCWNVWYKRLMSPLWQRHFSIVYAVWLETPLGPSYIIGPFHICVSSMELVYRGNGGHVFIMYVWRCSLFSCISHKSKIEMHVIFPEEDGGVPSFKIFKDISSFVFGLYVTSTLVSKPG